MSVYQRKGSDFWQVSIRYTDPTTGARRRLRRSTGVKSRREAERLEREWLHELEHPPEPVPVVKSAAFSGFARYWLDQCASDWKGGKAGSTYRGYESIIRVHLVPAFGDLDLRQIGPESVQRYKTREAAKRSPKSVNNYLGVLSSMFRAAVAWGYCERNPVQVVKPMTCRPSDIAFWEPQQSERYLATIEEMGIRPHAANPRSRAPGLPAWVYPFMLTALRTGLRLGELCALRREDVLLDGHRLRVARAYTNGVLALPKGGRERLVPISARLREVLQAHPQDGRTDLLFCYEGDGSPLSQRRVARWHYKVVEAAGVRRLTLHGLRHTFASQLVMRGTPLLYVQRLLGHVDIKTTQRYAHLAPAEVAQWVEKLDAPPKGQGELIELQSQRGPVGHNLDAPGLRGS